MSKKSVFGALLATSATAWIGRAVQGLPSAIGASSKQIQPYAANSVRYRDHKFHNSEPSSSMPSDPGGMLLTFMKQHNRGKPKLPIPLATPIAPVEAGELAITWYGHSSVMIEIDGFRVLADPVWSERCSPSQSVGPARMHPVPTPLSALPIVDAIVISHDHYDHLDMATAMSLGEFQVAPFVVPLGIGAHLRGWGIAEDRIIELDWDDHVNLGELTITCTEARHFSGRGLARDPTQWASWAFSGPKRRVFFGGDTGYTPKFTKIGRTCGPFDITLLPVGAYDKHWPDIHMNPEEAVQAHEDLESGAASFGLMIPVHWATFNLALHPWSEPIARMLDAAEAAGVSVAVPMPGQRIDGTRSTPDDRWWARIG